jgi:glycosyltransferase involved in cell wall biosynthesis
MDLSVVVPTLNGRRRLAACLDALDAHAPAAEVVVVNGPSADGTTGMVRERGGVDALVEVAERNLNVSRNAGIEHAGGDWIAFVEHDRRIEPGWHAGLAAGLGGPAGARGHAVAEGLGDTAGRAGRVGAVTGPTRSGGEGGEGGGRGAGNAAESDEAVDDGGIDPGDGLGGGDRPEGELTAGPERRTIAGREVTYFDGANAAFTRAALDAADGFDEYLQTGGARDLAHRLAVGGFSVVWNRAMSVRGGGGSEAGSGRRDGGPRSGGRGGRLEVREPAGDRAGNGGTARAMADGGHREDDWYWKYRALAYRLAKNYGLRPTTARRLASHAGGDALSGLRGVLGGEASPSGWLGNGRDVLRGTSRGEAGGLLARWRDRGQHNPNGLSSRTDRAVAVYDWR